ncbi:MAG: porin family protein [Chitinophagaceae bacterium]
MPENDFEKQVQQKMDELRFEPSETVWPEVEKEIREKKKRRVIFWLPLFALLLGGAAWLYFENNKNNKDDKSASAQTNPPALVKTRDKDKVEGDESKQPVEAATKKQDGNVAVNESSTHNTKSANENSHAANANKVSNKKNAVDKNSLTVVADKATADKTVIAKNNIAQKNTHTKITERKSVHQSITDANKNNLYIKPAGENINSHVAVNKRDKHLHHKKEANNSSTVKDEPIAEEKTNNDATEKPIVAEDVSKNKAADDITTSPVAVSSTPNAKPAADSIDKQLKPDTVAAVAKNKPADKSKKRLNWGVHVQAGQSAVSSGFTNFFSGTPSYYDRASGNFNSIPSNNNSSSGGLNSGGSTSLPPAEIKPGFSFGAGVFMNKALKKNASLLMGINYNYISTQITVGSNNTTTASLVQYNTGTASTYTNQFHFIELPVTLQKQLSAKSRFSLGAGLSFSWLLATNTLLYNSQSNTYFKDKSQVNKFQWGLQAGIYYKLFPHSFPIQVGPQFYYSANNIFDKQTYGSRHLMFAGLQANIFLPKKKK